MTTNVAIETIVTKANEVMKNNAKARKEWNASYYSLSKLLRDAQMKSQMALTVPVFESLGLATNGKVKPSEIMDSLAEKQVRVNEDGTKDVLLWSRTQKYEKNSDGTRTYIFEEDGVTPVLEDHCSAIKEGAWTLNKFCKLIAQRNAFLA